MSAAHPSPTTGLPTRARLAVATGRLVAGASKLVHFGSGSVIGGRAALLVDPDLLRQLTARREVVVVSATNGKTTTTRLLGAALGADRPVVSNSLGANMTPGIVAALGAAEPTATAVLEVDERWVGDVLAATGADTVVLLNLSRDQLDRTQEVRKLAERWRTALGTHPPARVVANADDPLVVWAASAAPTVVWVATGQGWTSDAAGCPSCSGRIAFEGGTWRCTQCDLARPQPDVTVDGAQVTLPSGPVPIELSLPGRVNRVNAAFALAAAVALDADPTAAAASLAAVREVAGRYRVAALAGMPVRLLLAKNPAGWHEAIDLLAPAPAPVVVAINARIADGHDPSWLWDVDFERLAGRLVVATGERRHDLAVRLRYAGVEHRTVAEISEAVRAATSSPDHQPGGVVDVAGNYTAFQEYLDLVGGPPVSAGRESAVRLAVLFPDLLGTYGDGGNALVLAQRLAWRDIPVDVVTVAAGEVAPDSCDLYLVGGGEDGPQVQATRELDASQALHRAVDRGAAVLAVCAGMQILGHRFPDATGIDRPGLGLLDCESVRVDRPRAVGELLTFAASVPDPSGPPDAVIDLGVLTGFENHASRTVPGPASTTLARVEVGEGNGDGTEGVVCGRIVGTYLHGPVLARNPRLADLLLGWVVGADALTPLDDIDVDDLRTERLRAARAGELAPQRSWRDLLRRS